MSTLIKIFQIRRMIIGSVFMVSQSGGWKFSGLKQIETLSWTVRVNLCIQSQLSWLKIGYLVLVLTHQHGGHLVGVRMDDEPVSVHSDQRDAGAGEEHRHALDAANRLAEPRLKQFIHTLIQ